MHLAVLALFDFTVIFPWGILPLQFLGDSSLTCAMCFSHDVHLAVNVFPDT